MKNTLYVNLYGGPGTGKSSTRAKVFYKMKEEGLLTVEEATEYAKDLTWENRQVALSNQPYILGKQFHSLFRLNGLVDVVITDSPILLCYVYAPESPWRDEFRSYVMALHRSMNTLDLFLERDLDHHPYVPVGRSQTEEQALTLDQKIEKMLIDNNVAYASLPVSKNTANVIHKAIKELLK